MIRPILPVSGVPDDFLRALNERFREIDLRGGGAGVIDTSHGTGPPGPPGPQGPPGTPGSGSGVMAPNVTATGPVITYVYWAHETVPVFGGNINYPTTDPNYSHFTRVDLEFIRADKTAIYLDSYPQPAAGVTFTPYSGWQEQIRQLSTDQPGSKLRFTSFNERGEPTLPPFETPVFTIPGWGIVSLTATDNPPNPIRWKDPISQAVHAVIPVTLTLTNYPHYCTVWFKSPQYLLVWHGWPSIEDNTPVPIGARGTSTIWYPPTGFGVDSEAVTVYAAIGIYDSWVDPSDPAQAIQIPKLATTTVTVYAPRAPNPTDAHGAWIEHVQYYSVGAGAHNWGWKALHVFVDTLDQADPYWFIRGHMQSGQWIGGVWTPGGQFADSENGWPGSGIGDWDTADDHDPWVERVKDSSGAYTNELIFRDNGGWPVPSDNNLTYRVYFTITSRRGGPDGTTIQQTCFSAAVDVSTPGINPYQDVTVDPTKADATLPDEVGALVMAIAAVEVGPRYLDKRMGQHTAIRLTPTLDDPPLGANVTFWLQFGDGKWVRQGVWRIDDTITDVQLGEQTLNTEGSPGAGNIWVPTDPKKRTWKVAAIEGNVETDDPPDNAKTATFDVAPVGACRTDDCTNIHFLINPASGDEMIYVLRDPGVWWWMYFELDWTTPTGDHDGNYWFSMATVETGYTDAGGVWHSYPDQWGDTPHNDTLYLGRPHTDSGEAEGGNPILGSVVKFIGHPDDKDLWPWPVTQTLGSAGPPPVAPQPNPWRTVRFRVYAVSRLGTDIYGGTGVYTLQPGWPGGADHFDLTPAAQPSALDLSRTNPVTSFDPNSFFRGGGGSPLSGAVAVPLQVYNKELALIPASIDQHWLADGAVTAQKTYLDAINNATGMLKANAVVCGLVNLPVSQLIEGSAIFTGDVWLSKGNLQPAMGMNNLGIWLWGAANAAVGAPPTNVPDVPGSPGHCAPQTNSVAGLTGNPWTNITSNKILMYGGDGSAGAGNGPSTLIQGNGITLFGKNGDLTSPYFAVQATGLSLIAPKTFGASLTPGQLVFTYDSWGTTWGTPVTGAPSPRVLLTNTLSANGMKVLLQLIPPPGPVPLQPSIVLNSNFFQVWTVDQNQNYPCLGIQGDVIGLTYVNNASTSWQTIMNGQYIRLQYLASPSIMTRMNLTPSDMTLAQQVGGNQSTMTITSSSLKMQQTGNNASVELKNTGEAVFTGVGGTSSTINGNVINTFQLTGLGDCFFSGLVGATSIGFSTNPVTQPVVKFYGGASTTAGGIIDYMTVQFNGQARKIAMYSYG